MDAREEFLRAWYGVLWSNIDRSMRSVWEVVGPLGLVGGAFIVEGRLGPQLTVALQLIVIFWALNNTMDMNAWHRRNLIFVSRVERQFLREADYGSVIPASFREPRIDWVEFYSINVWTFLGLLVVVVVDYSVLAFGARPSALCPLVGPSVVLLAGSALTACNYRRCERQVRRYMRETGGPSEVAAREPSRK